MSTYIWYFDSKVIDETKTRIYEMHFIVDYRKQQRENNNRTNRNRQREKESNNTSKQIERKFLVDNCSIDQQTLVHPPSRKVLIRALVSPQKLNTILRVDPHITKPLKPAWINS